VTSLSEGSMMFTLARARGHILHQSHCFTTADIRQEWKRRPLSKGTAV